MRIECPECDELVEVESFACERAPDRVIFYCPTCDEEVTVQSATDEGDDEDDDAPQTDAPKSALTVVPALDSDGTISEVVLQQLWELVSDDFSEGARHDAFIAACEGQNKLAFAAARYREWIAEHPEDEVAAQRQKQLLALAQVRALAMSSRQTKEKDPLRKALTAFVVVVVLLALVIVAAPMLLSSARGCRATQPGQSQLQQPQLPMVVNLRRRSNMGGYRGLTPRRYRRGRGQLRNLAPRPRPRAGQPAPMRTAPMRAAPMRTAPMRTAPMRTAPMRTAPMRTAPMPPSPAPAMR